MALPATDSFTATVGLSITAYSANWTLQQGNFLTTGSAIRPDGGDGAGSYSAAFWNADAFNDNQYAQGSLPSLSNTGYIGPGVRINTSTTDTYYGYYGDDENRYLFKMVSGTYTQLGSAAGFTVGQTARLEVSGTTLSPKINGTLDATIGDVTDASISSGAAGIVGFDNSSNIRLDNFEANSLAGGGGGLAFLGVLSNPQVIVR